MTSRVSVSYLTPAPVINDRQCPYEVEVPSDEGGLYYWYYYDMKTALGAAKRAAKQRGIEVWVFDGTIYEKNGKKVGA